ncbi:hypothetical protein SAMN02910342_00688 [Butyrivibrio sp. INlla21]|nr:hypothetical protein SAMN02910342_00688 [Butyrivibrio sp. INlla21]
MPMNVLLKSKVITIIAILNRIIVMILWLIAMKVNWISMSYEYIVFFCVIALDHILLRNGLRNCTTIKKILNVIGIIIINIILNYVFSFLAPQKIGLEIVYDTYIISQALIILAFIYFLSDMCFKIKTNLKNIDK